MQVKDSKGNIIVKGNIIKTRILLNKKLTTKIATVTEVRNFTSSVAITEPSGIDNIHTVWNDYLLRWEIEDRI